MNIKRGWWKLNITGETEELTDDDRNHIAHLIQDGYNEGEVIQEETDDEEEIK